MGIVQVAQWAGGRTLEEVEAAECVRSFAAYAQRAWPEVDPDPLMWGKHMQAVCDHLQAVTEGDIRQLIINIPPGHAKSMLVSVLWPSWVWIKRPWWKSLFSSYGMDLVNRDMEKRRTLMLGQWYTHWFRKPTVLKLPGWEFADAQNVKSFYKNTKLGEFTGLSVGSGTGKRGHCLVIDDPIDAEDANSKLQRDTVIRWKRETMSTRFNNLATAQQVLIMQRLHDEDLTGYLLREEKGEWEHLCLMSEFEPERRSSTRTKTGKQFFVDWRQSKGDLLFPELFPKTELDRLRRTKLGSYGYAGQHQQNPVPAEGGILQREYFTHRWYLPTQKPIEGLDCVQLPMQFDMYTMFTDAAFKKTADSDLVATGVFGLKGTRLFLLDIAWERMTFTETLASIIDLRSKWTKPPHVTISGVYVEDKANGTAVMDALKGKVPGLIPVEPDGGKEARIIASTPAWEAGNVFLPLHAPWVNDFIIEATSFPKAAHDDAIDMCAYAIRRMLGQFSQAMLEALSRM